MIVFKHEDVSTEIWIVAGLSLYTVYTSFADDAANPQGCCVMNHLKPYLSLNLLADFGQTNYHTFTMVSLASVDQ
jgi:hypothetical protein